MEANQKTVGMVLDMKIKEEWYKKLVLDYDYVVEQNVEDAQNFGNATVVLSSTDLIVRYVRDRSQLRIELANHSDPNHWFDLDIVYVFLNDEKKAFEKHSFEELNQYLLSNHQAIADLFSGDRYLKTKVKLLKLLNLRAMHIFRDINN